MSLDLFLNSCQKIHEILIIDFTRYLVMTSRYFSSTLVSYIFLAFYGSQKKFMLLFLNPFTKFMGLESFAATDL